MNKRIVFILAALFCFAQMQANSYKAQLTAKLSSASTGMGKVYISETEEDDEFGYESDSISMQQPANAANEQKTFYAFAKSKDAESYEFVGWSETDNGIIVSKDNPYKVNVLTPAEAASVSNVDIYANFVEKKLCTLSFVTPVNGEYSATDNNETIFNSGSITTREKLLLKAVPAKGYKVFGWFTEGENGNKEYFSVDSQLEKAFNENTKVGVDFVEESKPIFTIRETFNLSSDLNEICADAKDGDVIVLMNDGVLEKGNYNIRKGITLLIPFDSRATCFDSENLPLATCDSIAPVVYRTLTMDDGARLDIDGLLSISAEMYAIVSRHTHHGGGPNGYYGHIRMNEGSEIVVNNGGRLCAWGYVTGEGRVTAENGSCIYEGFQLTEFRGGSALSYMSGNEYKVFPINQYHVQNVEVPMTFSSGASEMIVTAFSAESKPVVSNPLTFIGHDGMFVLEDGSTVTKSYNSNRDRQVIVLEGNASIGGISFSSNSLMVFSEDYVLPLTNNLSITVNSGCLTIDKPNGVALLPDAELTIRKDAKLEIKDSQLYVYGSDVWGKYAGLRPFVPNFSPTQKVERTELRDAVLDIQGQLKTINGCVYTTEGSAGVVCTEGTGFIEISRKPDEQFAYQVLQPMYDVEYVPISIGPAKLRNSDSFIGTDNEYVKTNDAVEGTIYYYHPETGMWDTDEIPTAVSNMFDSNRILNVYSVSGHQRKTMQSGVNIVIMNDGRVQKVIMK